MTMTSNRPYLIRAIYDWIVDNNLTPHILVNAEHPDVQVPQDYVNGGRIVLNISPQACRGLHLENDRVVFTARFSGVTHQIFVVPAAILAIYAKENGRGMEFGEEYNEPAAPSGNATEQKGRNRPALKLIKKDES
ncbi:ClpXP protease specificity-enhancing factor [Legionella sp. CNM-1927-20]|uniref:ClpXP protease specificity-enhancing factor n=1 Tax=Legionella sp. CNM-1927-20 TaxID=3422221 RepID=UPI00403B1CE9